jgi:hypothetical protein
MKPHPFLEKRKSKRIRHDSQVIFTCDTSSNVILGAETIDCSKDGVQLSTSYLPEHASEIYIAWTGQDDFPDILYDNDIENRKYGTYGEYMACSGKIVWSKKDIKLEMNSFFIGIEIDKWDVEFPTPYLGDGS